MNQARLLSLPYPHDTGDLFALLSERPWAMWLDSGPRPAAGPAAQARYDIMVAEPYATVEYRQGEGSFTRDGRCERFTGDPFAELQQRLGASRPRAFPQLPFCGGALGYFAYDLARAIESLPARASDDLGLPEMAVGLYDWAVVIDHDAREGWLACQGEVTSDSQLAVLHKTLSATVREGEGTLPAVKGRGEMACNLPRAAYGEAFRRVKYYLREGDCYQVNLARRFAVGVAGEPWPLYRQLRKQNPAPFGAYLNLPQCRVLSLSPERFLQLRERQVETRPIKGTAARSGDAAEDARLSGALRNSPKDRAENLMIVDLLRNDLGRCCAPGSVHVPELFAVESYATVHHLVSTVRGTLAEGEGALSLLRAAFPGGSITGAPKLRAMQIIEELEPHRRSVYCGAIGYIGVDGDMDTNIAIRTAVYTGGGEGGHLHFWAGGGLVVDSDEEQEFRETEAKVRTFLDLLG